MSVTPEYIDSTARRNADMKVRYNMVRHDLATVTAVEVALRDCRGWYQRLTIQPGSITDRAVAMAARRILARRLYTLYCRAVRSEHAYMNSEMLPDVDDEKHNRQRWESIVEGYQIATAADWNNAILFDAKLSNGIQPPTPYPYI